ncbi:MAG TPA: dihydrofolate reductase family protein [Actinospica sp.]|jgi:dihydrofolate reductase|nr:dihydrofolate reductase family protein [Actinospica sp.]
MGRIIVSENVTLDGMFADPMGEEDSARDGWFSRTREADRAAFAELSRQEALGAEALLLGRRTCAWFAGRWPERTGEWADKLNGMPKYVVSTSTDDPGWTNTTVLTGDVVEAVGKLRQAVDGEIFVYGSGRLVRTLLEDDLVDELRLFTYPLVLGAGEHLLSGISRPKLLSLVSTRRLGEDLLLLTYRPSGEGRTGGAG